MNILLVGCGKMGSSLLQGWHKSNIKNIQILDPFLGKTADKIPANFKPDYIVLAIKPQQFADVLPGLKKYNAKVISVAAGKSVKAIKKLIGNKQVIRVMPNLPAVIGEGVSGIYSASKLTTTQKKEVTKLLYACGKVVWVKSEQDIDKITAISGSGPAYVFLFADSLAKAAIKLGFKPAEAREIALATIKGSVNLAENSNASLEDLIKNVASKGGTTEAALKTFKSRKFSNIIEEAAKSAFKRAKELSE